ncbi:MAG: glutathione binding-like protein, partial [Pseudomonadales bacterium]|nr:glutathione binding-like protein [Pseudomonadales bacterium]
LDQHLATHTYLCGNRFTMADIAVGYALYLGVTNRLESGYSESINDYLARLMDREAFKKSAAIGEELSPFVHPELWTMRK